jgi:hypothetical protein
MAAITLGDRAEERPRAAAQAPEVFRKLLLVVIA